MSKIEVTSTLSKHHLGDLQLAYQQLIGSAQKALEGSHSPYSEFPVGAAVLLGDGQVVIGSNQENAAFPSGLCAERTALFATGSQFPGKLIKAIAICVARKTNEFPFPCGACLQVMSEYQEKQDHPIDVLLKHTSVDEVLLASGVQNFLPFAFRKDHLGK